MKKAIIIGSSGLVGSVLLQKLLSNPQIESVLSLVRSASDLEHPKLQELVCDFQDLSNIKDLIVGDAVFFCIGTTRKKTPNLNDYRKIDVDIIKNLGEIAKKNGVQQAHLVSSVGANENASNFYLKIKGEAEKQLKELGFQYVGLYRPAMLIGKRKERRPGEKFGQLVSPFFDLFMGKGKYHSIKAEMVANSMYWNAKNPMKGIRVLHYRDMVRLQ